MAVNPAQLRQRLMDRAKDVIPGDARDTILERRMSLRQHSARWRGLPDFLVIGGMRCGTSSLYKYLGYHPDISPAMRKETDYFGRRYRKGEAWYRSHFPLTARNQLHQFTHRSALVSFEASPYYLVHPYAPARAADLLPDARLIVMLRDPVDRAYSHWQHLTRLGFEELTFEDALAAEEERLAPELERMAADPLYNSMIHRHFSYAARGRYAEQLERWLQHFRADRFVVVQSEDMYTDVAGTYAAILAFLQVSPWQPAEFRNYSYLGVDSAKVGVERQQSGVDPATRERLNAAFQPDQRRLPDVLTGMARAKG